MAYYDKIATKWHKNTGYKGGSFKELILNDRVLSKIGDIESRNILEIGIGNGYFMPLLLRRKSGQVPHKIYLTDISMKNLEIAKKHFKVPNSIYKRLDVYKKFSLEDHSIHLILSNMVFNEVSIKGWRNGIEEITRVLEKGGKFIISILHPNFIRIQIERGVIKNNRMTSSNGLKIPTVYTSLEDYVEVLDSKEINYTLEDVYGTKKLYNQKPKLKELKEVPIGLIISGETK